MLKKVTCLSVIALSMILNGSAMAEDTLWSVDIQAAGSSAFGQLDPPVLMEGIEPLYGYGNIWNAFNVPGHDLPALVDPAMQLVDSEGNATGVTFGITGNISGFSYGNVVPLVQDYLFVNAGNSDVSVTWSITGLKAGSTYELYTYGGGVVNRDIGLTVDEDGDDDLGNNQVENVPTNTPSVSIRTLPTLPVMRWNIPFDIESLGRERGSIQILETAPPLETTGCRQRRLPTRRLHGSSH